MSHLVFVETSRPGIQALEQALRLGYRVTRLVSPKFEWLLRPEDHAYLRTLPCEIIQIADSQSSADIEVGLRKSLQSGPIDAVLSVVHYCVDATAKAASALGLRATSAEGIGNARDKGRCRDLLQRHGIPSIRHRVVRDAESARVFASKIGYPVIVKPATGMGKVLTAIVRDDDELSDHFANADRQRIDLELGIQKELNDSFIVEEIAQGPLYSIELAADTHHTWAALTIVKRKTGRHNPVLELGSTVPSDLNDTAYKCAESYAISVAEALGLDIGIFHVELIMTTEGPRLVEVNPRIAGGAIPDLVRTATGVNLFELLVRIYAGERLPIKRLPIIAGASHTFIGALEDVTVREDLMPDWFEAYRPRLHSGQVDISPGQKLRRMDGNYDVYGVVRVSAASYQEAEVACENLRSEIQKTLGLSLVEIGG